MKQRPEIVDMGVTHFTQDELREFDDPNWAMLPDGITIHVIQCLDCGAHTNDGDPLHIRHHKKCKPGDAKYWANFYSGGLNEQS